MKVPLSAIKVFIGIGIIVGTVACGENGALGPASPSALSSDSSAQSSTPGWSARDESRVPPIRIPAGVTCPSDAPNIYASITSLRLDIEWSFIPMVTGYEIAIERLNVSNAWETAHVGSTGATRYEWRGTNDSRYRVRVRSLRCGGTGMWSAYFYVSVDGPKDPSTAAPPTIEEPECETVYAAGHTSRTQVSMPCNEEPNCEFTDYSTRGSYRRQTTNPCDEQPDCEFTEESSHTETYTNCDDGEEEPDCEQVSDDYSSRGSARAQMTPPCGFSWGEDRVRQRTRR